MIIFGTPIFPFECVPDTYLVSGLFNNEEGYIS